MPQVYYLDPAGISDITVDWSQELTPLSASISTSTWTVNGGLTLGAESKTATTTTVRVSNAIEGITYQLDNSVLLDVGEVSERSLFIRGREQLVEQFARQPVVTLEAAKNALKVTGNDEDTYIAQLVEAATQFLEGATGRVFVTKSVTTWLPCFDTEIVLSGMPVQVMARVRYYDSNNVIQVLDPSLWRTFERYGSTVLTRAPDQTWPATYYRRDAVELLFYVGYGDETESVPELAKQAVLMLSREWYDSPGISGPNAIQPTPVWLNAMINALRTGQVIDV